MKERAAKLEENFVWKLPFQFLANNLIQHIGKPQQCKNTGE